MCRQKMCHPFAIFKFGITRATRHPIAHYFDASEYMHAHSIYHIQSQLRCVVIASEKERTDC